MARLPSSDHELASGVERNTSMGRSPMVSNVGLAMAVLTKSATSQASTPSVSQA